MFMARHLPPIVDDVTTLPISRKRAHKYKVASFYDGSECNRGHVAPRLTSTSECLVCLHSIREAKREAMQRRAECVITRRRITRPLSDNYPLDAGRYDFTTHTSTPHPNEDETI